MNINITLSHFEQIIDSGYSLDMLFFLKLIQEGADPSALCEHQKMSILCQSVRRKGLLSENFKVTLLGQNALSFLENDGKQGKIAKKKVEDTSFEEWWKHYPGTDTFKHKDTYFSGTRGMRQKKDECKVKFNAIIAEGEYTAEELIAALDYDVLQKKENSVKTKSNRLTFMQNSLTYLNQRSFEPFIELIKEGMKIIEEPIIKGGTDI